MVSALVFDSTITRDLGTVGVPNWGSVRGEGSAAHRPDARMPRHPAIPGGTGPGIGGPPPRVSRCSRVTDSIDPQELIRSFGTIGLILIIFAESGLLIGFFLPGDSLLFTAGLFAVAGQARTSPSCSSGCFLAAVIGDQVGYAFGKQVGPSIFQRPNSRLFKQQHVERANEFFEEHGAKTIVMARFVPVVRTFAPILAGVGTMRYRTFLAYNVVGGFLWAVGVTLLGYFLGDAIGADNVDKYLLPIIGVIIIISLIPPFLEYRRHKRRTVTDAEAQAEAEHLHDIVDEYATVGQGTRTGSPSRAR